MQEHTACDETEVKTNIISSENDDFSPFIMQPANTGRGEIARGEGITPRWNSELVVDFARWHSVIIPQNTIPKLFPCSIFFRNFPPCNCRRRRRRRYWPPPPSSFEEGISSNMLSIFVEGKGRGICIHGTNDVRFTKFAFLY